MTTEQQNRVMEKVRKLLALANGAGASEGERENALRMAYALLAKHNMCMADAEASGTKGEGRLDTAVTVRDRPWTRIVAMAVAELYFCKFFYMPMRGSNNARYYFVGRESNVHTAAEMVTYLLASIRSEGQRRRKAGGHAATWQTNFSKGASHSLWGRCQELRRAAEAEAAPAATTGTALVLASLYKTEELANKQYIEDKGWALGQGKNRERNTGRSGYNDGYQYGEHVSLHKQVS